MKITYVTHSLLSCWNHGNAHFLRGVLRSLQARGHAVTVLEPHGSWSLRNLLDDHGEAALQPFQAAYPSLRSTRFAEQDLPALIDGADLVIVHEWTEPSVVAAIGAWRRHAGFKLLFHDTHHRAVSEPDAMRRYDLAAYDGVLAFGATLAAVYRAWGWGERVYVWHEAADVQLFHPPSEPTLRQGAVWIGNWGDGERTAELEEFLLAPMRANRLDLDIYGVRYPSEALALLDRYGARYHGWLANALAPAVFARHLLTVHVPRRPYAASLPGIPTIRVFEALACGIPLVSAPWSDSEHLFTPGEDFLTAADGEAMRRQLQRLAGDAGLRASVSEHGRRTILARHTCDHRAAELLAIAKDLGAQGLGAQRLGSPVRG